MRDAAKAILSYADTHTSEDFSSNEWDQAATIRNLEIIGEAAARIVEEFRSKHPEVPWRDIIDFRNFAIHNYIEVDETIVWNIIKKDVPPLLRQLDVLIESV